MSVYKRKAQYHETDQMGIIHHSNYIKWMEEAGLRLWERWDLAMVRLRNGESFLL